MKRPGSSDSEPCLIEIRTFGLHIKANGKLAVVTAAGLVLLTFLGMRFW